MANHTHNNRCINCAATQFFARWLSRRAISLVFMEVTTISMKQICEQIYQDKFSHPIISHCI